MQIYHTSDNYQEGGQPTKPVCSKLSEVIRLRKRHIIVHYNLKPRQKHTYAPFLIVKVNLQNIEGLIKVNPLTSVLIRSTKRKDVQHALPSLSIYY